MLQDWTCVQGLLSEAPPSSTPRHLKENHESSPEAPNSSSQHRHLEVVVQPPQNTNYSQKEDQHLQQHLSPTRCGTGTIKMHRRRNEEVLRNYD